MTNNEDLRAKSAVTEVDEFFELYDLHVEVICPPGARILCGAKPGDHFTLQGEMLHLPPGQGFSIYSLAAVLPLLAAKQRITHPNDWMSTDAEVACPDPNCPSRLRISRVGRRKFSHSEVTVVALRRGEGELGEEVGAVNNWTGKEEGRRESVYIVM